MVIVGIVEVLPTGWNTGTVKNVLNILIDVVSAAEVVHTERRKQTKGVKP